MSRLVVFISGNGTNLQAIIDACEAHILPAQLVHVVSNRDGVLGLERARLANIPTSVIKWQRGIDSRHQYDERLAILTKRLQPTLIVLAGFMHVLTESFLKHFDENQIINLHPALPGTFAGAHAIEDAYAAKVAQSGAMVHTVVQEIDAGKTLAQLSVPRFEQDTFEEFAQRIRYAEKTVMIAGIAAGLQNLAKPKLSNLFYTPVKFRSGKVRDVYDIGCGLLLIESTDRCSAFDRQICNIPQKGNIINRTSAWWFNRTRHIVDNHLVHSFGDEFPVMVVKRCVVFPVEFVVRGYITGTTNTAMWTLYEKGVRTFGDIQVGDGLRKNEQLSEAIVTPTTKSEFHDEPINRKEIIERGLMTEVEYKFCHDVALKLYECGRIIAAQSGLILVDTKYEFGINPSTKQIILIDELHTCDSSRYWRAETYWQRFEEGQDPERFDKDIIRTYVKNNCDPYAPNSAIPEIPQELIAQVTQVYSDFYLTLTGKKNCRQIFPRIPSRCRHCTHNTTPSTIHNA